MWPGAFAVLALLCGCNAVYGLDETGLVNDNPRTLLFDSSDIAEDLIDFPVPVFLDPMRIDYTQVNVPTTELRFYDPDTDTDLPFEIESWVPGGESVIWVRVPQIDHDSTSDRILMYFGPEARGTQNGPDVWTSYSLVVHGVPGRFQHAGVDMQPAAVGITSAPGAVGPGFVLGASGNHSIRYTDSSALFASWSQFTVELWLFADYPDSSAIGTNEPRILEQRLPLTGGRLFDQPSVAEYAVMQIDVHFTNNSISYVPTFVPLRRWVHMLWTFDGSVLWIYRNGALVDADVISSTAARPVNPTADLWLGDTDNAIAGAIDEVRISSMFRSDSWIEAQYRAMRGNFVQFPRSGERL